MQRSAMEMEEDSKDDVGEKGAKKNIPLDAKLTSVPEGNYRNSKPNGEKMAPTKTPSSESFNEDHWKLTEMPSDGITWSALTPEQKVKRVFIGIGKAIALLTLLYFFVCSIDLLSSGFRLVGGRTTGKIFRQNQILKNPVAGVMVGILTTVLVQSSSTSTSIIVSMVSADFLTVRVAIPIIMGANIGTTITNTMVSLTQAGDRNQFRRAFAGATIHDMFNWLTVIVMLIVEVTTGYLYHLTSAIMSGVKPQATGGEIELLGTITKPFVNFIVQLDKDVLECWSSLNCTNHDSSSLIRSNCSKSTNECKFLFANSGMGDSIAGAIIVVVSLFVLCACLIFIVKVVNSVLKGQIAVVIKKTLNAQIPYAPWMTGYIAILVGAVMTFLVQSSSVFTSALTPLVGLGVITVERSYPLTLGSNIGTTTTAILVSMAVEGSKFKPSMQIALCHLFFNVSGIILFYPIPFMRLPVTLAKFLGHTTAKYRWFAIVYIALMFVVGPAIFMGLSYAGSIAVIIFCSIILGTVAFITLVNILRKKRPSLLPVKLRTWGWLPIWLRSLEPYDRFFLRFNMCRKLRDRGLVDPPMDSKGSPIKSTEAMASTDENTNATTSGDGDVNQDVGLKT